LGKTATTHMEGGVHQRCLTHVVHGVHCGARVQQQAHHIVFVCTRSGGNKRARRAGTDAGTTKHGR
jgi:hypothetical protein